jgi:tuberculosinol/isotuberculosinol synthase
MDYSTFQNLTTQEIAQLVQANGPKVCVFALNGTRRWFMLEHAKPGEDFAAAYLAAITKRYIEIAQLLFDHGINTLLMPALSPYLMARGSDYVQLAANALTQLTDQPQFRNFYDAYKVRVRFYGDYKQCFVDTAFAHLPAQFDDLTAQTIGNGQHRLFWGVCAHDATETTIALSIRFYEKYGRQPDKQELISMYYGEAVPPVNIFISSAKLRAFDMPLISSGREDLYYSVSPSPYFTESQLRDILYDHLYARRKEKIDYGTLPPEKWAELRTFYQANLSKTLGVGQKDDSGFWHPASQVIRSQGVPNVD